MNLVTATTGQIGRRLADLLSAADVDPGCLHCHIADTSPLGSGDIAPVTPHLGRLGAAALRLALQAECLLPLPWVGPAAAHATAADEWAGLCRLAALALPPAPSALPGMFTARVPLNSGHQPGWLPDQRAVRVAVARIRDCLNDPSAFVDAEASAGHLADLHDALRVYAAEVELVDALHGITFEQAGGAA